MGRGRYFDLIVNNNCIRKGDLDIFTDFENSGSSCKTAGLTRPYKNFYSFKINGNGELVNY
jgi:hypothetical protein